MGWGGVGWLCPWPHELSPCSTLCPRDDLGDGGDADGSHCAWTHRVWCPRVPQVQGDCAPRTSGRLPQRGECPGYPDPLGPPLRGHFFLPGLFLPQVSSWLFGGSALHTRPSHSFPAPVAEPMPSVLPAKSASAGCLLNMESNNRSAGHLEGRRRTPEKGQGWGRATGRDRGERQQNGLVSWQSSGQNLTYDPSYPSLNGRLPTPTPPPV